MEESLQDKRMLQEKKSLTVFLNSHSSVVGTGKKKIQIQFMRRRWMKSQREVAIQKAAVERERSCMWTGLPDQAQASPNHIAVAARVALFASVSSLTE